MKKIIAALVLVGLASASLAQQTLKPEDMIKFRKANMNVQAWNMGKIKANLDGTFNKEQVIAAANVLAAVANSGTGVLFGPGTDKDVGDLKTRVKPELFDAAYKDKLTEVGSAFTKETNELAKVAATGDVAAIKAQFGKTGGTCKGCHDAFRKD